MSLHDLFQHVFLLVNLVALLAPRRPEILEETEHLVTQVNPTHLGLHLRHLRHRFNLLLPQNFF